MDVRHPDVLLGPHLVDVHARALVPVGGLVAVPVLVALFAGDDLRDVGESLDVDLRPGSMLVLFGPSGAGKTTILRQIAGLERPDSGVIRFEGDLWCDIARSVEQAYYKILEWDRPADVLVTEAKRGSSVA